MKGKRAEILSTDENWFHPEKQRHHEHADLIYMYMCTHG